MLSSLILCNNKEPFFYQIVTCHKKWILYNSWRWPAQWLDREETPKHFPKPNLYQKIIMVTVWWPAADLIRYSFLNPGETITSEKYPQQIDEMHRKLAVLAAGSIEWALFFSVTTLDLMSNSQHFKTWTNWAVKFCLICWIHQTSSLIHLTSWQMTTTSSSILTTFCREEASTTSRIQKMLSKSSLNPIAWVFMLQE